MKNIITENEVEETVLEFLLDLGYSILTGPDIAPGGDKQEREDYGEVVLKERLKNSLERINPDVPKEAIEEAMKKVLRSESPNLVQENYKFHKMVIDGIDVEYRKDDRIVNDKVWLFDFDNIDKNDFLAVNQFTVIEDDYERRPDIVIFINGVPISVIELKNPADENATIWSAYNQLQTYKSQISSLFEYNEILVISDGHDSRAGTLTSNKNRFMTWKTIDGEKPDSMVQIETLVRGIFGKDTVLDILNNFITFERDKEFYSKKLAAYHQYNAANNAIESTKEATKGDKKAGVVWHTQGSGKSLTMVFYSGKIIQELDNPTIVVLTDRNDLDDQLYQTFSKSEDLLRQKPVQAEDKDELKDLLKVSSGGIVFTTIQKFFPENKGDKYPLLSERDDIIVMADEAHRSQYGFIEGFAAHMRDALPNASYIGFTGTPIEKDDRSTPAVFGDYVDVYDIEQAVKDDMTVKIFYESRLAKLALKPEKIPKIDEEFEEVTEGEEVEHKEKLKKKWARMEKLLGEEDRIKRIAKDIVNHFENRLDIIEGKGMVVGMSREICVELYDEIVKLRPGWHSDDDNEGKIKVVMTGSASDPPEWQQHIRNKRKRKEIGDRFKDPDDPLKMVIVRDMWLTGFDVPALHTMYIDKPMKGHSLMQAIARVNRVYKDKEGGLIVDYIGVAQNLKKALQNYTKGDRKQVGIPQEKAVALMLEKFEIVEDMLHGFDYEGFSELDPNERMKLIKNAMDHILSKGDKDKENYIKFVTELVKAFSLASPHNKAMEIKKKVGFFQAVKSALVKNTITKGEEPQKLDSSIKQILSEAIVSDRVIDIFEAAGIDKPDISILSEEFLLEVKGMEQKNLAFETLKKLLNDEIKVIRKKNIVQGRSFKEMLEKSIKRYTNRSIETAEVIDELIKLAKDMKEAQERGEELDLSEEEVAFYDALADNDSAVEVLGDDTLRDLSRELADIIRNNTSIDWTIRETVQAKLRVLVKRKLREYGYPPGMQKKATELVLEQAKLICKEEAEKY